MADKVISYEELARRIELRVPDGVRGHDELEALCRSAIREGLGAVSVPPSLTEDAAMWLVGSDTRLVTNVGFLPGDVTIDGKLSDVKEAISGGAREISLAVNASFLRNSQLAEARKEVVYVAKLCSVNEVGLRVLVLDDGSLLPFQMMQLIDIVVGSRVGGFGVYHTPGFVSGTTDYLAGMQALLQGRLPHLIWGGYFDQSLAKDSVTQESMACYQAAVKMLNYAGARLVTVNALQILQAARHAASKGEK